MQGQKVAQTWLSIIQTKALLQLSAPTGTLHTCATGISRTGMEAQEHRTILFLP